MALVAKVKTTLMIDAEVLKAAKKRAIDLGLTLSAYFEQLVSKPPQMPSGRRREFKLPSHGSGGLMPGVDLNDKEAIEVIEEGNRWSSLT